MKKSFSLLFVALLACAAPLLGADALENPAHAELRAVRDALLAGMNSGDIEAQLAYLHPNVVVTWHNAEVSRGRDGVRAYLERMLHGPSKIVAQYGAQVNVDDLSILYGDSMAVAFGGAQEHFTLADGRSLDLNGRWTATLVKEGGKWLVASLHISDNLFDNPLLSRTRATLRWAALGSLIVGVAVGWLGTRWIRRTT